MRAIRNFCRDTRANVATMFALAIVPVVGIVGASVDYSRANGARTAMQAALDSTALAMSKTAGTVTDAQLQQSTQSYFNALYTRPEAQNVSVSATYTTQGGTSLTVNGSGSVQTKFMNALGYSSLNFTASSTVSWGSTKLRVALALDNTGSMADAGKIAALKTATHQLLTTLQNAAKQPNDVLVSIVPFAKDVNVGTSNYNQPWIDWTAWNAANGSMGGGQFCISGWCWNGHAWVQQTWVPANHNTWNGCVTDRDQSYDVDVTSPNPAQKPTLFPAEQYAACPVPVMAQTNDWAALNALVETMVPNGSTNQTIGLAWAWQTLTNGNPMNAPSLPANTQQAIVLLSDGLNTQNRWNGNGSDVSPEVDARMNLICSNAKAAGIIIYTVHVNTGGDPTSTVLQNCASKSSNFFALTTAGQILTAFNQIGTQLAQLRISR